MLLKPYGNLPISVIANSIFKSTLPEGRHGGRGLTLDKLLMLGDKD